MLCLINLGSGTATHLFADYVIPLLREIPNSQHSITNPMIEIDGDRALAECQWYMVHRIPLDDDRCVDQQCEGRYLDVFERRGGEWRILHRQTTMEALRDSSILFNTYDLCVAGWRKPRRAS